MTVQYAGQLPMKRRKINSHIPCESCGYRRSHVEIILPGDKGVAHRLCNTCDPTQQ